MSGRHIDDVQTATVDEHFKLLLKDDNIIEPNFIDVTPNNLPNWYDEKLFKEGQNYYKRNMRSMITASFAGLIAIIVVPETLKVLIYTEKSSIPCVIYSRYIQTLLHVYNLCTSDPNDSDFELNLCRKTAAETRELCQKVAVVLTEYLNNASAEFFHIALTILNALSYNDITLDKHAFLNFIYQLHGIQCVPYVGAIVKTYFKYMHLLMLWYVKKWPVMAWLSYGKKNSIQIILY